jgi:hypothetical protein
VNKKRSGGERGQLFYFVFERKKERKKEEEKELKKLVCNI